MLKERLYDKTHFKRAFEAQLALCAGLLVRWVCQSGGQKCKALYQWAWAFGRHFWSRTRPPPCENSRGPCTFGGSLPQNILQILQCWGSIKPSGKNLTRDQLDFQGSGAPSSGPVWILHEPKATTNSDMGSKKFPYKNFCAQWHKLKITPKWSWCCNL